MALGSALADALAAAALGSGCAGDGDGDGDAEEGAAEADAAADADADGDGEGSSSPRARLASSPALEDARSKSTRNCSAWHATPARRRPARSGKKEQNERTFGEKTNAKKEPLPPRPERKAKDWTDITCYSPS